jgi:hypothetical protein
MGEQLDLFALSKGTVIEPPKNPDPEVVSEGPLGEPGQTSCSGEQFLRVAIEDKECLIYLWGANPLICFVRTHSSDDRENVARVINRAEAELLLTQVGYSFYCTQKRQGRWGDGSPRTHVAKVYWRK